MNKFESILSQVNETLHSLPDWNDLENFVGEFHNIWLKLGNCVQQQLVGHLSRTSPFEAVRLEM